MKTLGAAVLASLLVLSCSKKDTTEVVATGESETGAVIIAQAGNQTQVTEGDATAATYSIRLNVKPTSSVSIQMVSTNNQVVVTPTIVTFTNSNYSSPQTVSVTAVDDSILEGLHTTNIQHLITTSDSHYNNILVPDVIATITDNDTAGVSVVESVGSTDVSENGAYDTYTVALTSAPEDNVVVAINPDAALSVTPVQVTFSPANWNVTQTIKVTAVDDSAIQGTHTGTITHTVTSTVAAYNGLTVVNVIANIQDNDKVLYVKANAAANGDGKSWGTAFNDLNVALANAISGQEIWVASGRYIPDITDRTKNFSLVQGVPLYGGFSGGETDASQRNPAVNLTTLSGDLANDDAPNFNNMTDNSYHVVKAVFAIDQGATTVFDGFQIQSGISNTASPNDAGGGMVVEIGSAQLVLSNLTFAGNVATSGGGLSIQDSTNVRISGTKFFNNKAAYGSGIHLNNSPGIVILQSDFSNNAAGGSTSTSGGGGIYAENTSNQLIVMHSRFSNNNQSGGSNGLIGGGIYFGDAKLNSVDDCLFKGNQSKSGGAIHADATGMAADGQDNLTIRDSIFENNTAGATSGNGIGGSVYTNQLNNLTVANSYFKSNTASIAGGAMEIVAPPLLPTPFTNKVEITNSIFDTNSVTGVAIGGGALYLYGSTVNWNVSRNIFRNNTIVDSGKGGAIWASYISGSTTRLAYQITNNSYFKNNAYSGGAVYFDTGNTTGLLAFSTFVENTTSTSTVSTSVNCATSHPMLTGNLHFKSSTGLIYTYNCAAPPAVPASAITNFVDTSTGDLHQPWCMGGAPCQIDVANAMFTATDPSATPISITTDIDGNVRDQTAGAADKGAYEYQPIIITPGNGLSSVTEGSTATIHVQPNVDPSVMSGSETLTVTITPEDDSRLQLSTNSLVFTSTTAQDVIVTALDNCNFEPGYHRMKLKLTVTSSPTITQYDTTTMLSWIVFVDNDSYTARCVSVTESGGTSAVTASVTDSLDVYLPNQPSANVTVTITTSDSDLTTDVTSLTFTPQAWYAKKSINLSTLVATSKTALVKFTTASSDANFDNLILGAVKVNMN